MNASFWQGKRVFLTGHTGFKGSWLSLWLQALGAEVAGYALAPPTDPSLFEKADVAKGMTSTVGDVRDPEALDKAMAAHDPEIVLHLAAQPLVRLSYERPVETYATNVMGTVHLLEAVRKAGNVRAVAIVTSDKCYENREWIWGYRENEAMGGADPYSSSKGCAELVAAAYRASFFKTGAAIATARAGNVIGGGDWAKDRLVPDILAALDRKQKLVIRHPDAIRPWQHVLESLSGYLLLAEKLYNDGATFAEAWNFGPAPEDVQPVKWIVERLSRHCGTAPNWQPAAGAQPHEAHFLSLDSAKARQMLGWTPRLTLDEALKFVAAWYKAGKEGRSARDITLSQIDAYANNKLRDAA
jgi:CDP-glucose 4,6-dehydratase